MQRQAHGFLLPQIAATGMIFLTPWAVDFQTAHGVFFVQKRPAIRVHPDEAGRQPAGTPTYVGPHKRVIVEQQTRRSAMSYWADLYMRHEQMIDRRQQAMQQRLIQQAKAATPRPSRGFAPLMASLGRRLTLWGNRLETQYGL
jgi:hypothetical protein